MFHHQRQYTCNKKAEGVSTTSDQKITAMQSS